MIHITRPPTALLMVIVLAILVGGCVAAIKGLYNPDSRIPPGASYPFEPGLAGANATIRAELQLLESSLADAPAVELELLEPVFKLAFPHNRIDTLFDKRTENAVVFSAETPEGLRLRFLVLRDGQSPRILAVDVLPLDDVAGTYIELPANLVELDSPLGKLRAAVETLLPELKSAKSERLSSSEYGIFGPFARNDDERRRLASRLRDNVVLAHLVASLETAEADVSVAAPVYALLKTTASAIYLPAYGLIQTPLWDASDVDVGLAHELTHAYVHHVLPTPELLLLLAVPHFIEVHPELYGFVIPLFYGELSSKNTVEESLAFIMGALADGRTSSVHIIRPKIVTDVLQIQLITVPILSSDVELLIDLRLLPECMSTEQTEFEGKELSRSYFKSVEGACQAGLE